MKLFLKKHPDRRYAGKLWWVYASFEGRGHALCAYAGESYALARRAMRARRDGWTLLDLKQEAKGFRERIVREAPEYLVDVEVAE